MPYPSSFASTSFTSNSLYDSAIKKPDCLATEKDIAKLVRTFPGVDEWEVDFNMITSEVRVRITGMLGTESQLLKALRARIPVGIAVNVAWETHLQSKKDQKCIERFFREIAEAVRDGYCTCGQIAMLGYGKCADCQQRIDDCHFRWIPSFIPIFENETKPATFSGYLRGIGTVGDRK